MYACTARTIKLFLLTNERLKLFILYRSNAITFRKYTQLARYTESASDIHFMDFIRLTNWCLLRKPSVMILTQHRAQSSSKWSSPVIILTKYSSTFERNSSWKPCANSSLLTTHIINIAHFQQTQTTQSLTCSTIIGPMCQIRGGTVKWPCRCLYQLQWKSSRPPHQWTLSETHHQKHSSLSLNKLNKLMSCPSLANRQAAAYKATSDSFIRYTRWRGGV